ncbi:DUF4352 domain-containing protein [Actinomadura macrotermitis]|nr:DUF4352 domain-containing protein [Actinomadura macrotermitis]
MRLTVPATGVALLLSLAAACSDGGSPKAQATYDLPARTVREGEQAAHVPPVSDGDTQFTLIGYTPALPEMVGSHADVRPNGVFVRVRLVAVNNGRTSTTLDLTRQRIVTAGGATVLPDYNARIVKRVPDKVEIGPTMRVEFDLWYDLPKNAKATALRLYGGITLMDMKDEQGVDLRLP